MAELSLDMTVPLGGAGHAQLVVSIADIAILNPDDRAFLADTVAEFCAFAGRTLAPAADPPPASIHDPSASILDGVRGSRIRDKL